jgi:hypothetical protein
VEEARVTILLVGASVLLVLASALILGAVIRADLEEDREAAPARSPLRRVA